MAPSPRSERREGSSCEAAPEETSEAYWPYVERGASAPTKQMGPSRREPPRYWPRPRPDITTLTADGAEPPIRAARRVQLRGGARRDERGVLAVRRARSEGANEADGPFSPRAASLLAPTAP